MRRSGCFRRFFPLAGFLLLGLVPAVPTARALDRASFGMEILVHGVPLAEYASGRTTYVEAVEGREYGIRLTNRTGRRVAVALSVDGLNTIDAKTTTARAASKWILEPYQTITLEGWQIGADTARRFFFTTEDRSYGAWLGQTRNLGVISAAVFRERGNPPVPIHRPYGMGKNRPSAPTGEGGAAREQESAEPRAREEAGRRFEAKADAEGLAPSPAPSDDLAATGIGRKVDHSVRRAHFDAETTPAAVLQIRYEYHDALVRLGVLPPAYSYREDPLARRERARGFEDFDFAPDPRR